MRIADGSIRRKLFTFYSLAGIVPLVTVVLLCLHFASEALLDKSFQQLVTTQSLRKSRIEQDFTRRLDALKRLNQRNDVINLFAELDALPKIPGTDVVDVLTQSYAEMAERYTSSLRHFLATDRYDDLLLLSTDGRILYSLNYPHQAGALLASGALMDSSLSHLWQRISVTRQTAMIDFRPYAEGSVSGYAAFLGQPYFGPSGKMTGIIALRLGPDLLDAIVDSRDGMGETGESYIIAFDKASGRYEFRTTIRTGGQGRWQMGRTMPELAYWADARARDGRAIGEYADSAGKPVLAAVDALDILGVDWLLASKVDTSEVLAPVRKLAIDVSILGVCVIVFMGVGALLFSANFTAPILKATRLAESIAAGDFEVAIDTDRSDELGILTRALDTMATRLRDQDWLKSGTEKLDSALRGEHDPQALAGRMLEVTVRHFDLPLGAVYLARNDAPVLRLASRWGWTDRDAERLGHVGFGDGMVGQAAIEREPIYFAAPAGAPVVDYGAGEARPAWFAAVPLLFEGTTLGVLLLGAFQAFGENQRRFLRDLSNTAGVLISAADSHQTIETLLKRAQEQENELRANNAELHRQAQALIESERELQTQQEELRVINEELEEQTRALRKSESELQAQQEELRVTNEELEERTQELETRSRAIQQKNDELVVARDEIRQKIKELETANRYKSEFLANMSHELRTPLNSILILSQLMAENRAGNLTARQVESARTINASGSDLLKLINDILDLSKVEAGKIEITVEPMALDGFVADLERVFRPVSDSRGIPLTISVADDVPTSLMTDSHRLQQVVRNLLSNAFKFTEPGGAVSLDVRRPAAAEVPPGVALDPADAVAFVVRDQGIGIPADRQADIFEAFRQADGGTSRKYGGTGLGLSISRRLAEALGGCITLTSEPGKGSTFTVILPASAAAPVAAPAPEPAAAEPPPQPTIVAAPAKAAPQPAQQRTEPPPAAPDDVPDDRRNLGADDRVLLIVEDDANFAAILRDLAHERGFKCLIASEGETGLHFADYYRPSAIILDVGLPGIDGWEVMSRLKSNVDTRHIPVHFISGTDNAMDALRMGAVGFLTKPISMERVEAAFTKIEEVLEKPVSNLLVVEDDSVQADAIRQLIGASDVATTIAASGGEALALLEAKPFDCMILDLGLKDISGFELLERMRALPACARLPVIIYTGRELSKAEEEQLQRHAESIIIKGVRSPERLLDESALFLHRVEASLPERQREMIRMVHDRDATLKDRTVLLVDDDMRNVFALSSVLEDKGLTVVIARDGRESLAKLKEHPEIDLVLMDIMMPEMDGYEAMREIRKERAHAKLPIIALTAKAMKGDRNKCIEAGANDYLAKPVNTEKLLSLLRVWLYK
ncbi:Signal transduction histidine kinase [uncultured Alphaproteobacteria bacterium]|uniref:histidine kinase n=1 Tax=uncultured Alphaproteobacteria bacterium TaxID=91750 RepID=A0A212JLZ5_9PROT|nr:Signal transduction histidine kinase [uncultured Alphaproteobacteria bacterium]